MSVYFYISMSLMYLYRLYLYLYLYLSVHLSICFLSLSLLGALMPGVLAIDPILRMAGAVVRNTVASTSKI